MSESDSKAHWRILTPVRGKVFLSMSLSALATIAAVSALWVLAKLVLAVVEQETLSWTAIGLATGLTIAAYTLRLSAFQQSHYAAYTLERHIRNQLSSHIAQLPLGLVQETGASTLSKVMMDDVKALHGFVADSLPLYARAYLAPLLSFALLWYLDWRLMLTALLVLMLGMTTISLAMRGYQEKMQYYNRSHEQWNQSIIEYIQAMPVVRSFDTGSTTFQRYQQRLDVFSHFVKNWYKQSGLASRLSLALLNPMPTLLALLGVGAALYIRGTLEFSTWLMALLIGMGMAEAVLPLMSLMAMIEKTKLSVKRIEEILALPPLKEVPSSEAQTPTDTSICFENVNFAYQHGETALKNVSFTAAANSVTALVGASGAGKTTVARLILRFWDTQSGAVKIGGVDVKQMRTETLNAQVGFVFQESFLLADTVANNIALGVENPSREAIIHAARVAQADDFIRALPNGYDTLVGERGVFLSGGQRQRLTIARAILQNRPILVLDEATAYADPEHEAALIEALSHLMRNKTVIIIAHRLSTICDAHQILVFDAGQLVERGQHVSLLAENGHYARLWRNHQRSQDWTLTGVSA